MENKFYFYVYFKFLIILLLFLDKFAIFQFHKIWKRKKKKEPETEPPQNSNNNNNWKILKEKKRKIKNKRPKKAKIVGDKQRVRDGRVENLGRWPKTRWHRPAQDKTYLCPICPPLRPSCLSSSPLLLGRRRSVFSLSSSLSLPSRVSSASLLLLFCSLYWSCRLFFCFTIFTVVFFLWGCFFFSAERGFCFWFCLGFWFFSKAKTTTRGSVSFFYQVKFGGIFLFINISKISSQLYKVRTLHPIDLCFCFVRFFQF